MALESKRTVKSLKSNNLARIQEHFAVGIILARWPHRNLDVLPQGGKKIHKAFDGETTRAVAASAKRRAAA